MKEIDSILKVLKRASIFDIFLISFVLLPFVFQAWMKIFKDLDFQASTIEKFLGGIAVLYVIFILLMFTGSGKAKRRELAKDQILGYLQSKNNMMMSFERIRERINTTYSDRFLDSVIDSFPTDLRHARLKGSKSGAARIVEDTNIEQEG